MKRLKLVFLLFPFILTTCKIVDISIYDYTQDCFITESIVAPLHMFLIGIDGWGSYSMPKANMPTMKRMMANGAYTLSSQAVYPTFSAPNWVSLFTGSIPVFHGYTGEGAGKPTFQPVILDEYGYFPNIFTLIRKTRPTCKIASFYEWSGIANFYSSSVTDTHQNIFDLSSNPHAINNITDYIETIKNEPLTFTFVHFNGADNAGHSAGYNTPEYYKMLHTIDGHIAKIETAVNTNGMTANTVFILLADHGGSMIHNWHGDNTREEREIPIIFYGKTIKNGFTITGNVNIYDIVPTISNIFGISKPNVWQGNSLYNIIKN